MVRTIGVSSQGTIWNYSHWSSSEVDVDNAWVQIFPNYGTQQSAGKYGTLALVRAVRSF